MIGRADNGMTRCGPIACALALIALCVWALFGFWFIGLMAAVALLTSTKESA